MYAGIPGRRLHCRRQRAVQGALPGRAAPGPAHRPGDAPARVHDRLPVPQWERASRPPTGPIPDAPGSYQFLDADGRVLYVGKAKSLRSRLSNYFADPATLPARTAQMVAQADRVEWIGGQTRSRPSCSSTP